MPELPDEQDLFVLGLPRLEANLMVQGEVVGNIPDDVGAPIAPQDAGGGLDELTVIRACEDMAKNGTA